MNQKVIISTNLTPNLIMHVFSCLEIEGSFYNSNYGLKHHFTILDEEYENWKIASKKCLPLGCKVELFAALFQIPGYIQSNDIETILEVYDKIIEAIDNSSIELLLDSYPGIFDNLSIYAPISVINSHFKRLNHNKVIVIDLIKTFQKILKGVWDRFYQNYWINVCKPNLEKKVSTLNIIVNPINIINAWQKKFNLEFPYSEFVVYLVEPTSTIATNLLAEKIIVTSEMEDMELYKIIIHEIGRTFLLNTNIFEYENLKSIAKSNVDRLSTIIDAVCIHIKKDLYPIFKIKKNEQDPYLVQGLEKIIFNFAQIWDSLKEKNIYLAIVQTYNKLYPII